MTTILPTCLALKKVFRVVVKASTTALLVSSVMVKFLPASSKTSRKEAGRHEEQCANVRAFQAFVPENTFLAAPHSSMPQSR